MMGVGNTKPDTSVSGITYGQRVVLEILSESISIEHHVLKIWAH